MESLAGWYNATQFDLITNGGAGLLSAYQNSILKMLKEIYPEEEWKPWLFKKVPSLLFISLISEASHGYWKDQAVIQEIIQKIEKKYRIGDRSSWYRVSSSQLQSVGATTAIKKRGGLYRVLTEVYPDIQWDPSLLSSTTKRSEQRILFELVKELFPDRKVRYFTVIHLSQVLEEYYHPSLLFPRDVVNNRRRQMQLDVFVPSLNLAFEYHGFQHYQDHPRFGSAAKQQERDKVRCLPCILINNLDKTRSVLGLRNNTDNHQSRMAAVSFRAAETDTEPCATPRLCMAQILSRAKLLLSRLGNSYYPIQSCVTLL